jgi:hypothetical protein
MPKQHKRAIAATVEIDGFNLCWELRREPQWSSAEGYRGMAISVRLLEGAHRELLLEYPLPPKTQRDLAHVPQRHKIVPAAIEGDIREAIAAGWDPYSRGRVFAFQVTRTPD